LLAAVGGNQTGLASAQRIPGDAEKEKTREQCALLAIAK
jgi:hypothetical protein